MFFNSSKIFLLNCFKNIFSRFIFALWLRGSSSLINTNLLLNLNNNFDHFITLYSRLALKRKDCPLLARFVTKKDAFIKL